MKAIIRFMGRGEYNALVGYKPYAIEGKLYRVITPSNDGDEIEVDSIAYDDKGNKFGIRGGKIAIPLQ